MFVKTVIRYLFDCDEKNEALAEIETGLLSLAYIKTPPDISIWTFAIQKSQRK